MRGSISCTVTRTGSPARSTPPARMLLHPLLCDLLQGSFVSRNAQPTSAKSPASHSPSKAASGCRRECRRRRRRRPQRAAILERQHRDEGRGSATPASAGPARLDGFPRRRFLLTLCSARTRPPPISNNSATMVSWNASDPLLAAVAVIPGDAQHDRQTDQQCEGERVAAGRCWTARKPERGTAACSRPQVPAA